MIRTRKMKAILGLQPSLTGLREFAQSNKWKIVININELVVESNYNVMTAKLPWVREAAGSPLTRRALRVDLSHKGRGKNPF